MPDKAVPRTGAVRRFTAVAMLCCLCAPLVAACQKEPGYDPLSPELQPIRISVQASSLEQRVLGELYVKTLNHHGRDAYVTLESNEGTSDQPAVGIDAIRTGKADLVITCIGEMLSHLDPVGAVELEKELADATADGPVDRNDLTWRKKTYEKMVNALPGSMLTSDPSNAVGCAATTEDSRLPQNIIAIYRKPGLKRDDWQTLNLVGGTVTTQDLVELTTAAATMHSVSFAVAPYVEKNGL